MGDNEKKEKKATRKSISLETKMQVIGRLDSGERQSQISAALNLATSTIRAILKNEEKILLSATATTSRSASRITCSRNNIIEEMEKRLSVWIGHEIERNMPLSQSIITKKARSIFYCIQDEDWFTEHFRPSVKCYCEIKKLEQRALLLIDNAPSHPTNLSGLATCMLVEVVFLPPSTTALIQPMDQGVISNFKAYYWRPALRQMFDKIDGEEKQSIREFWKNYDIMNAVENINLSWNEITERSLKGVWKNIWPDLSKGEDIGHSVDMDEIVEEIVELAKQTGLDEVNVEDVEEIIQETEASLSNDELKELTEQEENKNIDSSDFEEE
ncbi:tigger transposable element-derived protein 1-like [Parasteatoda tepidariorum]|uniref:tigger transposable element-derived protein 1-like n=1 Tax=Parasteatoda tepidariorum TaxID=114398 RepID=UPI001C71A4C8|nr:tigger transposable element-derived protein 1-like [Parasteatoda tepidariorum]